MLTVILVALGVLALIALGREVLVWRGLIDRRARRRTSASRRARDAWALTDNDGITPIRPGTRSVRGGTDRVSRQGGDEDQHTAGPEPERAPGRHAAPRSQALPPLPFLICEANEVHALARRYTRAHPEDVVTMPGPQRRGAGESVN